MVELNGFVENRITLSRFTILNVKRLRKGSIIALLNLIGKIIIQKIKEFLICAVMEAALLNSRMRHILKLMLKKDSLKWLS